MELQARGADINATGGKGVGHSFFHQFSHENVFFFEIGSCAGEGIRGEESCASCSQLIFGVQTWRQ
jgi:hypothetical protein